MRKLRVYYSLVVRGAPDLAAAGFLCAVTLCEDGTWEDRIETPVGPLMHSGEEEPRGGKRGGRGVLRLQSGHIAVACYDCIRIFTTELEPVATVSDRWMAGLHGMARTPRGDVVVAATAIDTVIMYRPPDDWCLHTWWHPRMVPWLQEAFGLQEEIFPAQSEYRTIRDGAKHMDDPSHLHLNSVAARGDDVYALFNRQGAIVNLTRGVIVYRAKELCGAHDLVIDGDDVWFNDTESVHLRSVSGASVDLRWPDLKPYSVSRVDARPDFLRGLDMVGDDIVCGQAPETLVWIDKPSQAVRHRFTMNTDARRPVHGVCIAQRG